MKRNKVYRIQIIGDKAWRTEQEVEDIELFRKEIAATFKVPTGKVKFNYEIEEPYNYKHKFVKGCES